MARPPFSEGILVGYRWFDRQKIDPLFPFGFGLSYTTFAYSGFSTSPAADGGVDVTMKIRTPVQRLARSGTGVFGEASGTRRGDPVCG